MDRWTLVSGETHETYLALLFRGEQRFGDPVWSKDQIWIVVINHLMNLPEVEMIGAQPAHRFLQLLHGHVFAAAMGADFGHHKSLIALAL